MTDAPIDLRKRREQATIEMREAVVGALERVDSATRASGVLDGGPLLDYRDIMDLGSKLSLAAVECRKLYGRLAKEERDGAGE